MESEKRDEEIIKRLNILIGLTLDRGIEDGLSMASKIAKLNDLGVSTADIARILGKPANYITAHLSQRKKVRKGKTKNE